MIRIRRLSDKKGFTLIEVMIASLIMAVSLFAVGTAVYAQFTALNQNRESTIATLTAQGELELLRGQPFDSIVTKSFYKEDAPGLEYLHYGAGFGKGDIVVDNAPFTGDSNIKRVSVSVTWNSINGKTLQRTMSALMARGGINKQ